MSPPPKKNEENEGTYIILVNKIKGGLKKIEWLASYQDIGPVAFDDSSNFLLIFNAYLRNKWWLCHFYNKANSHFTPWMYKTLCERCVING